MANVRLMVN